MHEMSLVGDVVAVALRYAAENNAQRVCSVCLRIGDMRDVVDELLQSCFSYLAQDTIAQDATLEVVKVPFKARCCDCGLVFPAELRKPNSLICPDCASNKLSIFQGTEFMIDSIEVR